MTDYADWGYHEIIILFGRFNAPDIEDEKGCTCDLCRSYRRKKWRMIEHGERKRWLRQKGTTRGNLTLEEAYALVEAAKGWPVFPVHRHL